MKTTLINLPYASSASKLWKSYLDTLELYIKLQVANETSKATKEKFDVNLTLNSVCANTNKIGTSRDWITIHDTNPDTSLSRKVCINFAPATNDESHLTIEFLNALDNDTNHIYKTIKKMKFRPEILTDSQLYMIITAFLAKGTANPSFYFTHSKFRI